MIPKKVVFLQFEIVKERERFHLHNNKGIICIKTYMNWLKDTRQTETDRFDIKHWHDEKCTYELAKNLMKLYLNG